MGKLVYLLLAIMVVQIAMIIVFDANYPFNSLWDFVHNPLDWTSAALPSNLVGIAQGLTIGAFVGGIIFNSDILIFAGAAGFLFSFGSQLVNLWQLVASQPEFCSTAELALVQAGTASSCAVGSLVATLTAGAIMLLYMFTVIEFWRGRD